MGKLFDELKRRNVVRVGIAYIVIGWVALQVADVLFDIFEAPTWVGKTFAAFLLLGFPFICLFAWAFELTPEGMKKTVEVDRSDSITHSTGKKLNAIIIVSLIVAVAYFIWERQTLRSPDAADLTDKSIAVLPFVNMSSDQEQEWFADGLTEEILNSLARMPDLLVASRTSSFHYKGRNEDISNIAAELGVAHVLEGSVRRSGDRLRVTAQLIRASDGFHLWSENFDREPKDVITIQENVAIEIARALKTAMDPAAMQRMVSAGTASVAAYEAYLQGLALKGRFAETGNIEGWADALELFDRAVAIDEQFALAHKERSLYWEGQLGITDIGSESSNLSREEIRSNYFESIDSAIRTTADERRALLFRANKAFNELRLSDSRNLLERYIVAYPNDVEGLSAMVEAMASMRDAEGARQHLERTAEIARDDPIELNILLNNLLFVGLVDEAVDLARDVLGRYPQHAFLVYQAHRALLWQGHVAEARRWADTLRASEFPEENIRLVMLRQACAEKDYYAASSLFDAVLESSEPDPSTAFIAMQIMNRPDEAHQLLVDADLDVYALASFLNYPYFDHNYFPELAARLQQQAIERPFVRVPPYSCDHESAG